MEKKGARNFALKFYKSKTWKSASAAYRAAHPLCEKCLTKGIYNPAQLVHHRIHIDENNLSNPQITLNPDNLESLCRKCHGEEHREERQTFEFAEDGSLVL